MTKLLLLLCLIPFTSFGQNPSGLFPMDNNKVTYWEVIKNDSVSAKELLFRAKVWLKKNYSPLNKNTQLEDTASNKMIVNGVSLVYPFALYYKEIKYNVIIETKDGRYKYTFAEFRAVDSPKRSRAFETWKPFLKIGYWSACDELNKNMIALIGSLKTAMKTKIVFTENNW